MLQQAWGSDETHEKANKRRRIRACDQCRRRKVRCDGADLPAGQRCGNCVTFGYECTHVAASDSKRFTDLDYVRGLEHEVIELKKRIAVLEAQAQNNTASELGSPSLTDGSSQSTPVLQPSGQFAPGVADVIEEDLESKEAVIDLFRNMSLETKHTHFLGRSSSLAFVRTAMALKDEYTRPNAPKDPDIPFVAREMEMNIRQPESWNATARFIRPEPCHPPEAFPDSALIPELVAAYFKHINVAFPLLHRPTFDKEIQSGLHLRDEGFGTTVLLVCAVGSRFSSDIRVLPEGTQSWHWSGWTWFQRAYSVRKLVHLTSPSVFDLQICVLFAWYVAASPVPHALYSLVGHGMRLAQDMGVHRRTTYSPRLTVEDELKKRAFWCLVGMERGMADKLGRSYNVHDEDFDIDLPTECDDEYWINDNPDLAFKQPPGKPSTVAMFNCILRLGRILAQAYRTIYCMPLHNFRADPDYAQRVVSELDSDLNKFIGSIPEHLRWDPQQENVIFLNQSALLYASYYAVQITVHRSFIPLPRRPSSLSFPSLAICTNAARSCIRVLERQFPDLGASLFLHWHQMSLFTCSVILLLNVWHGKRAGITINPDKELAEVQKAMRILQSLESRWSTAARFWDILNDIVQVMNRSPPASSTVVDRPQKRRREEDTGDPGGTGGVDTSTISYSSPESLANWGGTWARNDGPTNQFLNPDAPYLPVPGHDVSTLPQSDFDFTPPVHSDVLRRIPIWSNQGTDGASVGRPTNNMWPSFGAGAYAQQPPMPITPFSLDVDQSQFQIDPELEALFSELLPDCSPLGVLQTSANYVSNQSFCGQDFTASNSDEQSIFSQSPFTGSAGTPSPPVGPPTMWSEAPHPD